MKMGSLYTDMDSEKLKEVFEKNVSIQPHSKHPQLKLFLLSSGSQYERYFGNFGTDGFWISYAFPNQIINSTLKIMEGKIRSCEKGIKIDLSYKIPFFQKALLAGWLLLGYLFVATDVVRHVHKHLLEILLLLGLLFAATYSAFLAAMCFADRFLCNGKSKKEKLLRYITELLQNNPAP